MFVAVVAAGVAVAVVLTNGSTSSAVEHPSEWDPRIEPLAELVSEERGLDWAHPVAVRFEPEDAFVDEVVDEDAELSDEAREDLENAQREMEALSLLPEGVDLQAAIDETASTSILAFYSYESEEIVVRGEDLDVNRRATLAHELTHALQDQHFDLEALQTEAEEQGNEGGVLAVIEGDAGRIEDEYVSSLPAEERAEYEQGSSDVATEAAESLRAADVPEVMDVLFGYPYALGPPFVDIVLAAEGNDAVDDLFRPDVTEADVLIPVRYLDGGEPTAPAVPDVPSDAEETHAPEGFGAINWYFMLAARLDPGTALAAVDGWDGDVAVGYQEDETSCVAAAFIGQTSSDTERMAVALEAWSAAGPSGAADVERQAGEVVLRACEAESAPGPTRSLRDALVAAATRSTVFEEFLGPAPTREVAWCTANELAFDPELSAIFASPKEPDAATQAFITTRVQAAARRCLIA